MSNNIDFDKRALQDRQTDRQAEDKAFYQPQRLPFLFSSKINKRVLLSVNTDGY